MSTNHNGKCSADCPVCAGTQTASLRYFGADVTFFAVSIDPLQDLGVELSPEVSAIVPKLAQAILVEAASPSAEAHPKEMARCS